MKQLKPTPRFPSNSASWQLKVEELQQENNRYVQELRQYQDISNSIEEQSLVTVERFITCLDESQHLSQSRGSKTSHFRTKGAT